MDTPANSRFSGPVTHLLSMLCVLMKNLSHASATKETKRLKDFKIRTFIYRFSSDVMEVKGLSIEIYAIRAHLRKGALRPRYYHLLSFIIIPPF